MLATLVLGLLLGMQHAMEADHVAAVASRASSHGKPRNFILHDASWGLGRGVMLLLVGGAIILSHGMIDPSLTVWLDFAVGGMLVGLGSQVLLRFWHPSAGRRSGLTDDHDHQTGLPLRTFVISLMHGMAGSAALIVLSAASIRTPSGMIAFMALFAAGSVVGMISLTAVFAVPLSLSKGLLAPIAAGLQLPLGLASIGIGMHLMLTQFGVVMSS